MTGAGRRVEVVVDRLVLHDVDPADVDAVVGAFREHLTTLAGGAPTRGPVPDAAGSGSASSRGAAAIGRRAAASVWRAATSRAGAGARDATGPATTDVAAGGR